MLASNFLNNTVESYLINTANHINNHLMLISRQNLQKLIGHEVEFDINSCLSSLFSHQFYTPSNRCHSLRHSFINDREEKEYLPGPYSLVPIPDENNLYVASPVIGESLGWNCFEVIPSTEYLLSSYSWDNLICIPQALGKFSSFIKSNGYDFFVNHIDKALEGDHNQMYEIVFFNNFFAKKRYVPYLDTDNNPGKVKHEIINRDEFLNILTDEKLLGGLYQDQNFHYLAYKKIGLNTPLDYSKNPAISPLSRHPSKNQKNKISTKVVHVLFCDSLDINTLIDSGLIHKYPNIKKLLDRSLNLKRFTSSGGWTFPCLYSLYSGIPPYWSFSLFPARVDPTCRLSSNGIKNIKNIKPLSAWHQVFYGYSDYEYDHKRDYLSRRLKAHDIGQFALKQSSNHSWLYGLQHSIDFSIDNYANKNFGQVYSDIREKIDVMGKTTNVLFIDLDILHQNIKPIIPKDSDTASFTTSLSWMGRNISKDERLLGIVDDPQNELNKYLENLRLVDYNISRLLNNLSKDDSVVLFSDNGSDVLSSDSNFEKINSQFYAKNSIITYPKLMKPTLLVSDPSLTKDLSGQNSEELVSTLDLYDIILKLSGIDTSRTKYNEHLPILPLSLGGSFSRNKCYSFSVTKASKCKESSLILQNFELITRDHDESINYFISMPLQAQLPPDSLSHPDSVLDFLFD